MKFRSVLMVSLSAALVAGTAFAQDRLPVKQLSGPIDEVRTGVMTEAAPIEAAIHSKSAMIPVELTQGEDGVWRWQSELSVDHESMAMVLFAGGDSWNLHLSQPGTKSMVSARSLATELKQTSMGLGGATFDGDYYQLADLRPGKWGVSVEADAPMADRGYLLYSSNSSYRLLSYETHRANLVGNQISFVGYGFEKSLEEVPGTKANNGMVDEAWLRVTTPSGKTLMRAMFDDGLHGDGAAGDGVFGGSFAADQAGIYNAQMIATGMTPAGTPFTRTAEHVVPVIEQGLEMVRDFASARLVDEGRLEVSLAVDNASYAPDQYRVFAEVWGADANGVMQPVNWIGGMVYVENGQLSLGLDTRWIALSSARHGFELRNVRIEDPDHFIPVRQIEKMALDTPTLPAMGRAAVKSIDEAMLMGPRPVRSVANKAAGGKLMMVHGYCSGDAWGPVSGQFTGEIYFQDFNKNRSHNTFAQMIASFGSSYPSFGVVAHSQGGAASLHLYTYYWSGLDYADPGRLIQSVGTPYQGTPLAGNIAALGSIFGVGCGSNTDLTTSGASSWLSGIPSWARNAVNYYTTSFTDKWWRYDYCHLASDLLLGDPDDGTTEKSRGQLSSGVNRGHKTGQCHTTGMRDMPQTRDSGRNSTMNSNAAR